MRRSTIPRPDCMLTKRNPYSSKLLYENGKCSFIFLENDFGTVIFIE